MNTPILVSMNEDYKWLTKWEIVSCFAENKDSYYFEYAGEDDSEVWFIPKDKAKVITTKTWYVICVLSNPIVDITWEAIRVFYRKKDAEKEIENKKMYGYSVWKIIYKVV